MNQRMLFVDDDANITEAFKRIFRGQELEVATARSGLEGLALLEEREAAVVVSDERMPGMAGTSFLAEVRNRYPDTIRIVLTGYATLESALDAINEAQVYRFVLKPCSFAELGKVVREALEIREAREGTRRLFAAFREQAALLDHVEAESPAILKSCAGLDHVVPDALLKQGELTDRIRCEIAHFEKRRQRLRSEVTRT